MRVEETRARSEAGHQRAGYETRVGLRAVVAEFDARSGIKVIGWKLCDVFDGAADVTAAVKGTLGALQYFNPLDVLETNGLTVKELHVIDIEADAADHPEGSDSAQHHVGGVVGAGRNVQIGYHVTQIIDSGDVGIEDCLITQGFDRLGNRLQVLGSFARGHDDLREPALLGLRLGLARRRRRRLARRSSLCMRG